MRFRNLKWRWIVLLLVVGVVCLFVFGSNRFLYLSHHRFPYTPQWTHQSTATNSKPIVVGHRGSGLPSTDSDATSKSRLIGNTREAIDNAIRANVDWIEIDIRKTRDNELVVFHDQRLDEKTNIEGTVKSKDLKELQTCDVSTDPKGKILSLKDVLGTANEFQAKKRNWILDIKAAGIAGDVISLLESSGIDQDQIIIFGNHDVLRSYQDKGYRLGYTTLFGKHSHMFFSMDDVYGRCESLSCDLLVVPTIFVTPTLVSSAKERRIDVWTYDSNDPRDLKYCMECGVQGVIVDTPAETMSQFITSD